MRVSSAVRERCLYCREKRLHSVIILIHLDKNNYMKKKYALTYIGLTCIGKKIWNNVNSRFLVVIFMKKDYGEFLFSEPFTSVKCFHFC